MRLMACVRVLSAIAILNSALMTAICNSVRVVMASMLCTAHPSIGALDGQYRCRFTMEPRTQLSASQAWHESMMMMILFLRALD